MATMTLNLLETGAEDMALLQFISTELALRGSAIALISIALILLCTKNNASERSLLWLMLIIALALLPAFALFMPQFAVAFTVTTESTAGVADSWYLRLFNLAGTGLASQWSPTLQSALLSVYSLIVSAALAYLVVAMFALLAITRRSMPASLHANHLALEVLSRLRNRSGMDCKVQLLFSAEIQSPLTWGIWRHRIILPCSATKWREDLLAQALSHELAHIQRMDWVSHMLSRLVLCLYWFNPVNWWLHTRFIEDSEKACDQIVIDDTGCALTYAENLLWFAGSMRRDRQGNQTGQRTGGRGAIASALLNSRSVLYRRVEYLLANQHYYTTNGRTSLLVSIIFSVLLVAPASAVDIKFVEQHVRPPPEPQLFQVSYYPRGTPQHSRLMGQFGKSYTF